MRISLLCSAAALWPGLAFAQLCPASAEPAAPAAKIEPARGDRNAYPEISRPEIDRSPALRRIASNGATLLNMGTVEGVLLVFAYKGERMEVFHVLPGGRHAVRSGRLMDLGEDDPAKRDITTALARKIPGVEPQVEMTGRAAVAAAEAMDGNAVLAKFETTAYGLIGSPSAPRLWMVFDPLCPYSRRAIEELRPAVAAGKVQVALVPVPMLDREPEKRSSAVAAQLLTYQPDDMDRAWTGTQHGEALRTGDDAAREKLRRNTVIAASIGVRNSPTFVWRDQARAPQSQEGAQNLGAVLASLAPPR